MALGKRRTGGQELWIATMALPKSPGHPFYQKPNQLLSAGAPTGRRNSCVPHNMPTRSVDQAPRRGHVSGR